MPPRPRLGSMAHLGDAIAVAVVILFAVLPFPEEVFRTPWPLLPVALLPAVTILLRRRWALIVLGINLACAVVLACVGLVSPGALVAVAISAFAVADRRGRLVSAAAVLVSAVTVFLSVAIPLRGDFFDARALQFVSFIVLAGALGDATRSRREFAAAMTERAESAERGREIEARRRVAEERVRIARDLHDVVAHQIAVISLSAGVASSALDSHPERAREALGAIRRASRTVLADIGGLMALLRSEDPDDTRNLHPQNGLADTGDLVARFVEAGTSIELHDASAGAVLSPASDHVAYLVLLEGLTNAHKHGTDGPVVVRLDVVDDELVVEIRNEARPGSETAPSGHGLLGLRERVTAVRGTVQTESDDGVFRLDVRLPTEGRGDEWSR